MTTRREFLRAAFIAGAAWPYLPAFGQGGRAMRSTIDPAQIPSYRAKVIPIERWAALRADFAKVLAGDGVSRNKTFRASVEALDFGLPAELKDARSIIVLATFAKPATADFKLNGQARSVLVPFQYYEDEWTPERLKSVVQTDIVKETGHKLADISKRVPLKYLAARGGLGVFGRNNLFYVDGMGSYNLLHAFATEAKLPGDPDGSLGLLGECRHCNQCVRSCPTSCLGLSEFFADAGRCLALFNEIPGEFPSFILPSMHNALMGCTKCQTACPENRRIPDLTLKLGEASDEETMAILKGKPGESMLLALRKRLRLFPAVKAADFLPVLKRNLGVLIRA
jgi:epoxyqueuosine reductase